MGFPTLDLEKFSVSEWKHGRARKKIDRHKKEFPDEKVLHGRYALGLRKKSKATMYTRLYTVFGLDSLEVIHRRRRNMFLIKAASHSNTIVSAIIGNEPRITV